MLSFLLSRSLRVLSYLQIQLLLILFFVWLRFHYHELNQLQLLVNWNKQYEAASAAPTLFEFIWKELYHPVYDDEYVNLPTNTLKPYSSTLTEALLKDSSYLFVDNITTPEKETLKKCVTMACKNAINAWLNAEKEGKQLWGLQQDTHVDHLLKLPAFSQLHLNLSGGADAPNAITSNHGPSWRMIVHLTKNTEAYGIYPGGQQGNPGSKYYNDGIEKWSKGVYHTLWLMTKKEVIDPRIKWRISFTPTT
jgi:penicillin amidase